ncbi:hypothetical protein BJY52DRAFT_1228245 [Lactarius psammicola]|nr:hypothetical protein BJY52DRAFT_1228245 [Lactarius psammicola]
MVGCVHILIFQGLRGGLCLVTRGVCGLKSKSRTFVWCGVCEGIVGLVAVFTLTFARYAVVTTDTEDKLIMAAASHVSKMCSRHQPGGRGSIKTKKTGNKPKSKSVNQRAKPASTTPSVPRSSTGDVIEEENAIMTRIANAKKELEALQAQKDILAKEVAEACAATSMPKIGRPREEHTSRNGLVKRLVRDLCGEVGINWELPWADISAAKKAKLYQAACEGAPYLKKFANDWPTQALAMQLLKNKRAHSYRRGYLEVLESQAHTSQQGATTPSGDEESDGHEPTDTAVALGSKCKAPAAARQPRRKKQKTATAARSVAKGKGKGKKSVANDLESGGETQGDEVDEGEE